MKNKKKPLEYTNEAFKEELKGYLVSKKEKQEKREQMHWFFRRLCVDPLYEAKINFVERVLEEIDALAEKGDINTTDINETRPLRHLVRSGFRGHQGFQYSPTQLLTSRLCLPLHKKNAVFKFERKSCSAAPNPSR